MNVYIITARPRLVKVGKANDPWARLGGIATGNPYKLRLVAYWPHPHAPAIEKAAHVALSAYRTEREWFAVSAKEAEVAIVAAINDASVLAVRPGKTRFSAPRPYVAALDLKTPHERYVDEAASWIIERERRIDAELGEGAYKVMPRYQRDKWAEKGMQDWPRPYPPMEFIR